MQATDVMKRGIQMKNLAITTSKGLLLTGLLILGSVAVANWKIDRSDRASAELGIDDRL